MPWEVHRRERTREGAPTLTLSTTGRIALNRFSAEIFKREKANRVDLLWDAEEKKIGIQVQRNRGSYLLRFTTKSNGAMISAATFFNYIGYDWSETHIYPATWDAKTSILMIDIPADRLGRTKPIKRDDLRKARRDDSDSQNALPLG